MKEVDGVMVSASGPTQKLLEYGIMWSRPGDMSGSVTPMTSREIAIMYLALARAIPGGCDGQVVSRHVVYSDWEPEC